MRVRLRVRVSASNMVMLSMTMRMGMGHWIWVKAVDLLQSIWDVERLSILDLVHRQKIDSEFHGKRLARFEPFECQ